MKRWLVVIGVFFCGLSCMSQGLVTFPFSSDYDEDAPVLIGLQYNYHLSQYILDLDPNWSVPVGNYDFTLFKSIQSRRKSGFSVGIPIDIRLTERWYTTIQPSFAFINNTSIDYASMNSGQETFVRQQRHEDGRPEGRNFNSLEIPLRVKYRSDEKTFLRPDNRYRAYLTAGAKLTRWLGILSEYRELQNNPIPTNPIVMKPEYVSWEVGVGTEIYFNFFRMTPEIKFSQSIGNILAQDHPLSQQNPYMEKLHGAMARSIQFSLIFQ